MTREELKGKKIGVLNGGLSAEREVSLRTGRAVHTALQRCGYHAVSIDAGRNLAQQLATEQIEVAFIALHGRYGEDGTVQGLLELLGIPYTGSGVLASSLAIDKIATKKFLLYHGLSTPSFQVYRRGADVTAFLDQSTCFPLVAKPAREGSTIGVTIAQDRTELHAGLLEGLRYDDTILVEQYIAGSEVTVSVLDGQALPIIQVVPKAGFYDYTNKYTPGRTEYLLPAPLPETIYQHLQEAAVAACSALGCCGAARADFMIRDHEIFCLEVNTIPGMTETSLLPKAAAHAGIDFDELVLRILDGVGLGK